MLQLVDVITSGCHKLVLRGLIDLIWSEQLRQRYRLAEHQQATQLEEPSACY
jgi:hypothetical protein